MWPTNLRTMGFGPRSRRRPAARRPGAYLQVRQLEDRTLLSIVYIDDLRGLQYTAAAGVANHVTISGEGAHTYTLPGPSRNQEGFGIWARTPNPPRFAVAYAISSGVHPGIEALLSRPLVYISGQVPQHPERS